MEAIVINLYVCLIVYGLFIISLIAGFAKVKYRGNSGALPKTTFSIVVPFRDEAANLPLLLETIKNLDYPKALFEIILVDDFSADHSQSIVYKWRMENGGFHTTLIENVRVSNSPKKDAISRAVPIVANDWMITTDADCILNPNWLLTLNDYISNHDVSMVAGAVTYQYKFSFLHHFQQMDLMALQGATIGSFGLGKAFMCNGANFAYTKQLFLDLNGFTGNDKLASGDDVFLLQKAVSEYPEKVHYLKSKAAIVVTTPVNSLKELFFQRVRWASKTVSYESDFGETLALVVFLGNLSMVIFWILTALDWFSFEKMALLFGAKFMVDFVLLLQTNGFLRNGKFLFPIVSSLLYPFFSVVVALYSLGGKYEWKGRKLR